MKNRKSGIHPNIHRPVEGVCQKCGAEGANLQGAGCPVKEPQNRKRRKK